MKYYFLSQIKSSSPIIAVILFLLSHGDIVVERKTSVKCPSTRYPE
jgi:hypothetical protein